MDIVNNKKYNVNSGTEDNKEQLHIKDTTKEILFRTGNVNYLKVASLCVRNITD